MLTNFIKSRLPLKRVSYSLCTNGQQSTVRKIILPAKFGGKGEKTSQKKEARQCFAIPIRSFIYPFKPHSLRIDSIFYNLLIKNGIKEVVALHLKDHAEDNFMPTAPENLKVKNLQKQNVSFFSKQHGQHNIVMYKTQQAGIPFIKNIDDVYPIGTLCDVNIEDYKDSINNYDNLYILTLVPKHKVVVNSDQNKQMNDFYVNGVVQYDSGTESPEAASKQIQYLIKLYGKAQQLLQSYYLNNKTLQIDQNLRANDMIYKKSSFINQLSCFISNTTAFLSTEQKFQLFKQTSLQIITQLLLTHYKKYVFDFADIWNQIADTNETNKNSATNSLDFINNNISAIMKVKAPTDPQWEKLKQQVEQGKKNNIFPPHILKILESQIKGTVDVSPHSNEIKNKKYRIKTLLSYPFGKFNPDNYDIDEAKKVLDEDHFGMNKVKQRIIEFLAVGSLHGSVKSKVILLHGPPGVGKTSIVKSIAKCMGRPFHRISLGGQTDPSTLRGHKRTYIKSYPGKIFEAITKSKVQNPIILLDEIDKMQRRHSGGSVENVLMNILDPAQNSKFKDDYVDAQIDISNVLFICTANKAGNIITPLLDRMQKINVDGYTSLQKKEIFKLYLLPKAIKQNGLEEYPIKLTDDALDFMIDGYNRQPGVRSLEQTINKLCQNIALKYVSKQSHDILITRDNITKYLGAATFLDRRMYETAPVGVMVGLAYSEVGGGIMYIQATKSSNNSIEQTQDKKKEGGKLFLTGNLKTVIKESSEIAYSYANYILGTYFKNNFLENNNIHLNFVGVSVPKQGPSAGAAITSTLISLALNKPTKKQVAMTGQINLSGYVTKIGGVKQKVLGAKRQGITNILLPLDNKYDYVKLDDQVKQGLNVKFVEHYSQVMKELFDIDLNDSQSIERVIKENSQ